jgi:hypothetical protein
MDQSSSDQNVSSSQKKPRSPRVPRSTLDVGGRVKSLEFQPHEMPEEMNSRLRNEEKQANHVRRKEMITLTAAILVILSITGTCLFVAFDPATPEDRRWAIEVLTPVLSVSVGYLWGKGSRSDS